MHTGGHASRPVPDGQSDHATQLHQPPLRRHVALDAVCGREVSDGLQIEPLRSASRPIARSSPCRSAVGGPNESDDDGEVADGSCRDPKLIGDASKPV